MQLQLNLQVLSSTVLSTHLVVSSQLSKFQMFPLNQYNFHLYEAAKLLNSCGHLWMSPNGLFVLTLPPGRVTLNRINPANKTMNNISDKIESMFLSWNQCLAVFLRKFFFFFKKWSVMAQNDTFCCFFLSLVFCGTSITVTSDLPCINSLTPTSD